MDNLLHRLRDGSVPDGTVLLVGVRYDQERPGTTIYTYAMLKAGGLWYVTGTGRGPVAAGWGAVLRWLSKDGRTVVSVDLVTETRRLYDVGVPAVNAA